MSKPLIHLFTICWNEEAMLEFFFRHYDKYVDKYVFYDNGSDDRTLAILNNHPKAEVRDFPETEVDSFVMAAQRIQNSCWKESKQVADWVIITPVDEFLYHPDLISYLQDCKQEGISMIPALGYQMISDFFPESGADIIKVIRDGAPWDQMNKLSLFNPNLIDETNYLLGRHKAKPSGTIKLPEKDELLNLHFKYLSFEFTYKRHIELFGKLGEVDKENKWAYQYSYSRDQLKNSWDAFLVDIQSNVIDNHEEAHFTHSPPEKRWGRNEEFKWKPSIFSQQRKNKKKLFTPLYFILDLLPENTKLTLKRAYLKPGKLFRK